jgi:hypothetical protein
VISSDASLELCLLRHGRRNDNRKTKSSVVAGEYFVFVSRGDDGDGSEVKGFKETGTPWTRSLKNSLIRSLT